ncbi:MAG TPA: hypothetical protein VGX21_02160 [Methylomirabilota bacterium]|jgi:hypothetical protein|nr:hypothetical protein [Methylomirabilota bacterium]
MANRFDELAMALAGGMTRRGALRLLGIGAAAAGLLGPLGRRTAWAGPGCGRACQDAGFQPGSRDFVDCVHACGQAKEVCEVNALEACVAIDPVAATVTVTCCGGGGTCNTLGVCVCPSGTDITECTNVTIPTFTCCTGGAVCDNAAGVCVSA